MVRERLGLSTEPQPVFVGGCFALIMFFMQFYTVQISSAGNLLAGLNTPTALLGAMLTLWSSDWVHFGVWILKTILPIIIIMCAVLYGKNHAKWLVIPCSIPVLFMAVFLTADEFATYYLSYIAYLVTVLLNIIFTVTMPKNKKPFIVYCVLVCVAAVAVTALRKPPFTLFDGSIYLSDLVYFVSFHICTAFFAYGTELQSKAKNRK